MTPILLTSRNSYLGLGSILVPFNLNRLAMMGKVYILSGVVAVSIATLIYYRHRQYQRTAPARHLPSARKNEDINRGRLGDVSGYDRLSNLRTNIID